MMKYNISMNACHTHTIIFTRCQKIDTKYIMHINYSSDADRSVEWHFKIVKIWGLSVVIKKLVQKASDIAIWSGY